MNAAHLGHTQVPMLLSPHGHTQSCIHTQYSNDALHSEDLCDEWKRQQRQQHRDSSVWPEWPTDMWVIELLWFSPAEECGTVEISLICCDQILFNCLCNEKSHLVFSYTMLFLSSGCLLKIRIQFLFLLRDDTFCLFLGATPAVLWLTLSQLNVFITTWIELHSFKEHPKDTIWNLTIINKCNMLESLSTFSIHSNYLSFYLLKCILSIL